MARLGVLFHIMVLHLHITDSLLEKAMYDVADRLQLFLGPLFHCHVVTITGKHERDGARAMCRWVIKHKVPQAKTEQLLGAQHEWVHTCSVLGCAGALAQPELLLAVQPQRGSGPMAWGVQQPPPWSPC